jgi:hypothetical protein
LNENFIIFFDKGKFHHLAREYDMPQAMVKYKFNSLQQKDDRAVGQFPCPTNFIYGKKTGASFG